MPKTNGKQLRFAAFIRVSTERQADKGESLRTQRGQIERAVEALGGRIVEKYGGQEHATAGWEKAELDRLLADSAKPRRPFDAVIVADPSRWSRDNLKSETGLLTLSDARVRFFVLQTEKNLFNPEDRFFLAMFSVIGGYQAGTQKLKSLQNRIARAKRGIPTGGHLPFARIWNPQAETWSLSASKLAMIKDVGKRYLTGESLETLAHEYGVNHSNLVKVLRERSGTDWSITFSAPDLNIHEVVHFTVPALLPPQLIREIKLRLDANRTYLHGKPKYRYLLAGHIFCAECGRALTASINRNGRRYYRHSVRQPCAIRPRPYVRADVIEGEVIEELFWLFGNPARMRRAMKAAIPDCENLINQKSRIDAQLKKIDQGRNRILTQIERDTITDKQAESKLTELKQRETVLRNQIDSLNIQLTAVTDADEAPAFEADEFDFEDEDGNRYVNHESTLYMGRKSREFLVKSVFGKPLPDGKPAGVYVTRKSRQNGPKRYIYELRGRFSRKIKRATQNALH